MGEILTMVSSGDMASVTVINYWIPIVVITSAAGIIGATPILLPEDAIVPDLIKDPAAINSWLPDTSWVIIRDKPVNPIIPIWCVDENGASSIL